MKKLGIILIAIGLIGFSFYHFFYSLDSLPTGDMIKEVESPNGDYTFKAYLVNGGATVAYAVRGEVVFNKEIGRGLE